MIATAAIPIRAESKGDLTMADQTTEKIENTDVKVDDSAEKEAIELSEKFDKLDNESTPEEKETTKETDGDDNKSAADDKKTPAKEEIKTETKEPVIDDTLLDRASKAGLSIEEAKAYGTPEALTRTLDIIARTQKPAETAKEESGKTADAKAAESKVTPAEKLSLNLNREDYEDDYVNNVESFEAKLNERLAAIEAKVAKINEFEAKIGKVDQVVQHQEQSAAEELANWYDGKLSGLGEDYEAVIGKGATFDLEENSEPAKLRAAIMEEMVVTAAGLKATGKPVPKRDALFDRAIKAVLSDKVDTAKGKKDKEKIAEILNKRANQIISKPGAASRKELTAEEEAIEISKEYDKLNTESDD